MSITSAMFTGVSGLLANAEGINVIGNNLANVNTVGFKSGRMLFSDMLSANIGNESQIGRGTQIQKVDNVFSQNTFETTESVTDLGIQGNSFFAVMDPNATAPVNQNGAMLTRAGAFRLDSNFNLINPDGYKVLDTAGNPIQFSDNAAGITAANTAITTAYTPPATAYNTQAGTVNTAAGDLVTAVAAGTPEEVAAAAAIQTAATAAQAAATAATVAPSSATIAAAQAAFATLTSTTATNGAILATNFGPAFTTFDTALTTANTANAAAMTTAAAPIATAEALLGTANGLAFSKITSINPSGLITYLGKDGITTNYYNTSGQVGVAADSTSAATVQRLAVVSVANPGGLEKAGGTLFRPTTSSGVSSAAFTLATNSANGSSEKIYTNSLEQSNVDMAAEFVKMILTQRAYSANSKTITTADEMIQEVLNLKR